MCIFFFTSNCKCVSDTFCCAYYFVLFYFILKNHGRAISQRRQVRNAQAQAQQTLVCRTWANKANDSASFRWFKKTKVQVIEIRKYKKHLPSHQDVGAEIRSTAGGLLYAVTKKESNVVA